MKRLLVVILLLAAGSATANAQRRATVSGIVADAETKQNLIGALIGITPAADSSKVSHIVSGAGGTFSTGLTQGEYNFEVSLLGYETTRRKINVDASRFSVDTLYMQRGIVIDAVVKEAVALRTSMEGDTLIYNADSYKVAADADVSGLLQKMPGIKVENGTVEAQGETVKKVLIDGREFFGEDVNAAITSLPAEAVKSIEVFDKLSDNAEFTGIDDGEGYKAINIRTRESMRQGVMGKVFATYGVEPSDKDDDSWHHYGLVSGNVSIFQGDAKITVGGTLNNLNERNFTSDDFLGAGGGDGPAKVGAFRANYVDTWGKKDQWKIDASYGYNYTDADNLRTVDREYFNTEDDNYSNSHSKTWSNTRNQNHSLNARIDFKPNQYHELRIRPSVRYQGNRSSADGYGQYFPLDPGVNPITLDNWNNSENTGWNTGLSINYRVRLGKPGRTLSVFFNGRYNTNDRDSESYSERQNGSIVQQLIPSYTYGYNIWSGLTYTEPISATSLINLDYTLSYNYSDIEKRSYLYNASIPGYEDDYNDQYSGIYNTDYLVHKVGPGYRMQKKETTLSASVFYQHSHLTSVRMLPNPHNLATDFDNVTYSVMLNSKFNKNSSLRVFLNSYTRNPSVEDMQDVVDISNVQNISRGNPGLRPSYGNRMHARLIIPNVEKGRTFSLHMNASYTANTITSLTVRDSEGYEIKNSDDVVVATLDAVGRFSQPINMNNNWSLRFGADYGLPLSFMKSNLNLRANVSYQESPSKIGKWNNLTQVYTESENRSGNLDAGGGLVLGSNISEKVDFRIGYNISYNNTRNNTLTQGNSGYLRHVVNADFKFVLPLDFTVAGNVFYTKYNALTGTSFDQEYVLASASIGKKVFRNRQGEINLFVNDIFNQNVSFRRNWSAQYIQNETNSVIGRYFGVKFTWNIRKFGKNGSQNPAMYENTDTERRPDGPPPGGGGGGRPPGGGGYRGGF